MSAANETNRKAYFIGVMKRRILSGELKPGDRIPPERELAAELGIETAKLRKKDDLIAAIVAVPVEPGEEISEDDLPDLSAAAPVV